MNRAERRQDRVPTKAQLQAQASRRRIILLVSLGVIVLVGIIAVALGSRVPKTSSDAPTMAQISVGQKAPDFTVSTTSGPFELVQNGGKPTLLEVFASWCPHCQHEVSVLNPLYAAYRNRINIVAVSGSPYAMDSQSPESQADVVTFMTRFGAHYPIAFDPELDVAKKYLQGGFPTFVLIDPKGTIRAIGSGEIAPADLKKALDNDLAGKPIDPKLGAKS